MPAGEADIGSPAHSRGREGLGGGGGGGDYGDLCSRHVIIHTLDPRFLSYIVHADVARVHADVAIEQHHPPPVMSLSRDHAEVVGRGDVRSAVRPHAQGVRRVGGSDRADTGDGLRSAAGAPEGVLGRGR